MSSIKDLLKDLKADNMLMKSDDKKEDRSDPTTEKPSSFSSGYTLKARRVFLLSTIVTKLEADGAPMRLIAWSFTFSVVECDAKHFCLT